LSIRAICRWRELVPYTTLPTALCVAQELMAAQVNNKMVAYRWIFMNILLYADDKAFRTCYSTNMV
jgi:hypothetical protein